MKDQSASSNNLNYDVIIVGARCAGGAAAKFIADKGYSVLLLDKTREIGSKLCTHIIGETDIYEKLGIKSEMESVGSPLLTRMRIDIEGNVMESDIAVTPRAISLRREFLDSFILSKIKTKENVTFKLSHNVKDIILENNIVVGVKTLNQQGKERFYSKIVIGADEEFIYC